MAQVYAALGNTAAKAQEMQEFQRLRQVKQAQQARLSQGQFQVSDVTRQTLDADAK
jgi:hypothetical protein